MQNPLAADQGKQFLSQFPSVGQGKMYHEGHCDTGRVKILCLRVAAELHPECRHLVRLVADLQGEGVQGAPQDIVWAVVEWLEGRDMTIPRQMNSAGMWARAQPGHVQRFCVILVVRLSLHRSQLF
jgi:hypothetical protein